MRVFRFTLAQDEKIPNIGELFCLAKDENHHAFNVLRLKIGTEVEILSPKGLAKAKLKLIENDIFYFVLIENWNFEKKENKVILALSLINNQRFEWALEKAVELGANVLQPLITKRSTIKTTTLGSNKIERWQKIANTARKQCGRTNPFLIEPVLELNYFIKQIKNASKIEKNKIYYLDFQGEKINNILFNKQNNIVFLIGPEGGFSEDEKENFKNNNFEAVSLGPITLRAETAALACLAFLN